MTVSFKPFSTRLSRILAPLFSLSLLAGYVVYSQKVANFATNSAEWKSAPDETLQRLLPESDPLVAALSSNAPRLQLQQTLGDSVQEDAFPRHGHDTQDSNQSKPLAPIGPFFQVEEPMMMAGTKSGVVKISFPLRLSQAFESVPVPDDRTWIRPEHLALPPKGVVDQLADPVAMRTILAEGGTSGRLAKTNDAWKQGRFGELHWPTSVTVTDYPESGPPATAHSIVPERSMMMSSSKSGAVRFVFEFAAPKPSIFPRPVVNDPKAMDPKTVETILHDNGTALAKSGRLLTPEKVWANFEWHSTLMRSSKSGPVFQPPLFDFTQPLLKAEMPIKP